jgi:hypothetical protein
MGTFTTVLPFETTAMLAALSQSTEQPYCSIVVLKGTCVRFDSIHKGITRVIRKFDPLSRNCDVDLRQIRVNAH